MKRLTLLMYCPDKKGIIADVTQYINRFNGNIIYIDQYVDRLEKVFFMRVVVENNYSSNSFDSFKNSFNQELCVAYKLKCDFFLEDQIPQLAVFVSKYEHCLYDILSQYQSGKLTCKIHFVLSNHENLKNIAGQFKIPFYHIPIFKKNIKFSDDFEINHWIEQWILTYEDCLKNLQNKNIRFISYEKLCSSDSYWQDILEFLGINDKYNFSFKNSYKEITLNYDKELLKKAFTIHNKLTKST